MTSSVPDQRFILAPHDPDAPDRVRRLHDLGFRTDGPDAELDRFAERMAHVLGAPYAMVNFVLDTHQYFAGLYASAADQESAAKADPADRTMDLDDGFCPHVVDIDHALVLDRVVEWPRFGTNNVIRMLGVRSYIGAPFYDGNGRILGTVCAVSTQPSSWGTPGVELIKSMAAQVTDLVARREREVRDRETRRGQWEWVNPST
jgi:GAF domain-containing protein